MSHLLVPDASVILEWVLPRDEEPHAGEARRLLADFVDGTVDLVVPSPWYFELGNTGARRFPDDAARVLAALRALDLPEPRPTEAWEAKTLELVAACGVTFHDAACHALAIVVGGTLVTRDQRYRARSAEASSLRATPGGEEAPSTTPVAIGLQRRHHGTPGLCRGASSGTEAAPSPR